MNKETTQIEAAIEEFKELLELDKKTGINNEDIAKGRRSITLAIDGLECLKLAQKKEEIIDGLMQTIKCQKQTHDAMIKRLKVFELPPATRNEHIEGLEKALKSAVSEQYDTNGAAGIIGALFCECRLDAMIIKEAAQAYAANMEDKS